MATQEQVAPDQSAPAREMLIDTDVHVHGVTVDDLLPYLDPAWHQQTNSIWFTNRPSNYMYTPGANATGARASWVLPGGGPFVPAGSSVDALRQHLFVEEGVSIAIVNGLFHPAMAYTNYEFAQAVVSAYNDWQIHAWLEQEPRLRGSIHVVAHDPLVAVREIERLADHPQIVQVFVPTPTDRQFGDPYYRPIFEAAAAHDLVVAFHLSQQTQTITGFPRYFTEYHTTAHPMAAMGQITSMICGGVFDTVPDLKVVFLESGVAWLPFLMWRFDDQYKACRSELPWLKRLPSEYMREHIRISTQPLTDITSEQFAQLVEMVQSQEMFVFSSDYPHYDADSADTVLPSSLPEELYRRVRYQNALETYPRLRSLL